MFLLWLRQLPQYGDQTPALVPPSAEGRSSPTNTAVFPPSSFVLPSFAWFYIFFSTSQVLLSIPSWWSACTSVYEGVFLMYPWREMYSMSTYSSTILLSVLFNFWSVGCMMCGGALLWRIESFLLTSVGCRCCCFWSISSICFSDIMVSLGLKKL